MAYLLSFMEGIITFISPCLLPMLPIYATYFTGQTGTREKRSIIKNAIGFVLGFTFVFVALGAFAGSVGSLLLEYRSVVNSISGFIVVILGLNFLEVIKIPFLNMTKRFKIKYIRVGFLSSIIFGMVFSIGWTPCVGAFLGSALAMAATSGKIFQGILLLLMFSLGLGLPFIISALLIDRLGNSLEIIKRNYKKINFFSGIFLIAIGILIMTGIFSRLLNLLAF